MNNVIIGKLNMNSFPNKFDELKVLVNGMLAILIITETKPETPFQFHSFISMDFLNHIAWTAIETGVVSLYM